MFKTHTFGVETNYVFYIFWLIEVILVWFGLIHYSAFSAAKGHVALDRNPGPGYDILRIIPGDILSACPHRQFHTLPNSYPNALRTMQGGILYHFNDGLWYDPAGRRTHDLACERRTREVTFKL